MKRILCLCPVPNKNKIHLNEANEAQEENFHVGLAVSDPYLAYASTISMEDNSQPQFYFTLFSENDEKPPHSLTSYPTNLSPTKTFLEKIGYSDIGGILFSPPLLHNPQQKINTIAIDALMKIMTNKSISMNIETDPFYLQCQTQHYLTLSEARQMSLEEPEMWEEIPFFDNTLSINDAKNDIEELDPTTHAAAALNKFLWEYTGGWKNNTFG